MKKSGLMVVMILAFTVAAGAFYGCASPKKISNEPSKSDQFQAWDTLSTTSNTANSLDYYLAEGELRFFASIPISKNFTIEASESAPAVFVFDPDKNYVEDEWWVDIKNTGYNHPRHFVIAADFYENEDPVTITIRNIIFRTKNGFGGIEIISPYYSENQTVNVILENCVFENLGGQDVTEGGAIHGTGLLKDSMGTSYYGNFNLTANNCVFQGNKAGFGGAAYLCSGLGNPEPNSSAVFTDCVFIGNTSINAQGAVYGSNNCTIEFESTQPPPPVRFPAWAIVLIVFGSLAVLSVGGAGVWYFGIYERKLALVTTTAAENGEPETEGINTESENVTPIVVPIGADNIETLAKKYELTAREKEIVTLLVEGKSRPAIAKELYITNATVKTHVNNVYSKLEINSRFELIAKLTTAEEK